MPTWRKMMTTRTVDLKTTIAKAITETELARIEGWEGLSALADRIEVSGVHIATPERARGKWSVRGIVELALFNWDDERFGKLSLQLMASGHGDDHETLVDCMLISPEMH